MIWAQHHKIFPDIVTSMQPWSCWTKDEVLYSNCHIYQISHFIAPRKLQVFILYARKSKIPPLASFKCWTKVFVFMSNCRKKDEVAYCLHMSTDMQPELWLMMCFDLKGKACFPLLIKTHSTTESVEMFMKKSSNISVPISIPLMDVLYIVY